LSRILEFHVLLTDSIEEAITDLVGHGVMGALYFCLAEKYATTKDTLPYRLETLMSALRDNFGESADIMGKAVAKRFCQKLELQFVDVPGWDLIAYVEQAKVRLQREIEEDALCPMIHSAIRRSGINP
jgi:hypothetical protein